MYSVCFQNVLPAHNLSPTLHTANSNNVAYSSQQIYENSEPPPAYGQIKQGEESPTDIIYCIQVFTPK